MIRTVPPIINCHPLSNTGFAFVENFLINADEHAADHLELTRKDVLRALSYWEKAGILQTGAASETAATVTGSESMANGISVYIPFEELINIEEERAKLEQEITKLQAEVERGTKMLSNPGFVNKAPAEKVEEEKEKLQKYKDMLEDTKSRLAQL